jgi:hypothetical protein
MLAGGAISILLLQLSPKITSMLDFFEMITLALTLVGGLFVFAEFAVGIKLRSKEQVLDDYRKRRAAEVLGLVYLIANGIFLSTSTLIPRSVVICGTIIIMLSIIGSFVHTCKVISNSKVKADSKSEGARGSEGAVTSKA